MKLVIITAEPANFVPEKLKEEAVKLGHECEIIDIRKTFVVESTEGPTVYVGSCSEDEEKVETKKLTPPFVCIPRLNEHDLEYKLSVLKRLEAQGAVLLNSAESMARCNDKLLSQVMLNSEGIKTPYSVAISSVGMIDEVLKVLKADGKLKFPMIIKTLRGTHGIGVMKVDSQASLVSVAQAVMSHGIDIMLQEFIEHDKSARMIMIGDELLAANLRGQPEDKDEFRTNSHLGSKTQKYEPKEEELALGKRIVELFGCRFCAIDYIVVGDDLIILEVNGSPGLEAIQKDWEGDKNLALEVVKACAKLTGEDAIHPSVAPAEPAAADHGDAVELKAPDTAAEPETMPADALSDVEPLNILRLTGGNVDARVDSGAAYSSLHGNDVKIGDGWVSFERNGVRYKVPQSRSVKIRNSHGKTERPIVKLDVEVRGKRFNDVDFTVTDRASMKFDALIGRNLLKLINLPIMVPQDDAAKAEYEEE